MLGPCIMYQPWPTAELLLSCQPSCFHIIQARHIFGKGSADVAFDTKEPCGDDDHFFSNFVLFTVCFTYSLQH